MLKKFLLYFFSSKGKTNRSEFARDLIVVLVTLFCLFKISSYLEPILLQKPPVWLLLLGVLASVSQILMIFIAIPVQLAKRLHDLAISGWWALLVFIPLINFVILLYALFAKGVVEEAKATEAQTEQIRETQEPEE